MRYSSIHTHTLFCDGKDDVETLCRRAWEKGLVSLGFSSHAPVRQKTGFVTDWHIPDEKLGQYLDEVRAAKSRWEGRLRVLLGLEVDYIEGLMGPSAKDIHALGLDYVIGSVHYVVPPRGSPFTVDESLPEFEAGLREGFSGDAGAMIATYWDAVEGMIHAGGFDVLGHVDLVKKNLAKSPLTKGLSANDLDGRRFSRIAALLEGSPVVVEINTGGLNRGYVEETYPGLELLRLLRERNVLVTITADAHCADQLDGHYELARETLLRAGYTEADCVQW
ncbi:MAG: histidinol-phosphatase [Treponema sp.]|jgi:histidinol-phosphatase (PHP family)|nr:histidinol-phosphatase [Treponema sp.]